MAHHTVSVHTEDDDKLDHTICNGHGWVKLDAFTTVHCGEPDRARRIADEFNSLATLLESQGTPEHEEEETAVQ